MFEKNEKWNTSKKETLEKKWKKKKKKKPWS
jgi:hypothetical protein